MYAIEEGVRIREKFDGKVIVITMVPPQAEQALREAVGIGVDEAILLSDRAFAGSDTWATSYALSKAIQKIGSFDIILCGKQASDGDTAQVGPGISAHLNIPQITYVKKIEEIKDGVVRAERMTEDGFEIIEAPLPVLLTVVKEINEPRLPSLKGLLKAKKITVSVWNHKDIGADVECVGLKGSPTQVVKIFSPPPRPKGQIFEGIPEEAADKLVKELKNIL
jgi:electron transfer flavoprotein beta subunit